jgi:uncharacterized membrane protein
MVKLRKYFLTGLVIILPIWVLFQIFVFADNLLGRFINEQIKRLVGFYVPGISLILTFIIVIIIGFLASRFLGRRLLPVLERWFLKFPLTKQIYIPAKQIVEFLFSQKAPSFKQVVMVEYPRKGIWSIGFITNDAFEEVKKKTNEDLLGVYIPSSPNPITAYLAYVPKKDVIFLDISVEQGLKLIVSGGILQP